MSEPVPTTSDADLLDPTLAIAAARGAADKGATDIVVLQVGDVLAITDYFVIVSASNPRLVRAVTQDIEERVFRTGGVKPVRIEGLTECEWVLIDFGAFVAHVFHTETRSYYELERLWADVPRVDWIDPMEPVHLEAAAGSYESAASSPGPH